MNQTEVLSDSQQFEKLIRDAESKKRISLKNRLSVLPYRFWLANLREVSLIITLLNNYDKIPRRTPSRLIVGLFHKHAKMKKLLYNLEKRLRSKIY